MKKTLASVLTTAMVVGAASTTFAAANPFSDVPAGHWAYDAVTQLAADGVIEGYGDGTFRGDQSITRYEMAQMIAKAMAKNPSGVDKAMLDRLAAEFREELNNLGVRVANLEKHADMVQWKGKLEYTYANTRIGGNKGTEKVKTTDNGYVFRLEPKAEVNDHWTVNARLDAKGDMKGDTTGNPGDGKWDVQLKRAWAQGDYDKFQIKLGKMQLYTNETGLIFDDVFSGVQASYGDKFKGTFLAGRMEDDTIKIGANDTDPTSFWGVNLQYDPQGKGFKGGLGYYYLKDEDFRNVLYRTTSPTNKASIFTVNAGYNFSDKASLWGAYAHNSKADNEKNAWQVEFDYGDYKDAAKKGSWNAYLAYRKLGYNTSLVGTYDGVIRGTKGIEVGAAWAPFKNIGLKVKYFNGKTVTGGIKASKFFGRVEFFF
jgi:hypothetical protein